MDETRYRQVEQRLWTHLGVQPTEQMVPLPSAGTEVRVQEVGEGPPILFIHGGAVNGSSWATLAAELQSFRCLLVDRPGCGLSRPARTGLGTVDDLVTFADELTPSILDGLGIDQAHVVCTSLGGLFGFHSAAVYPERVDKLVGIGAIFGSPMDNVPLIMRLGTIKPLAKLMARIPPSRQAVRAMLRQIGLKDAVQAGRIPAEFEDWFLANMRDTDAMVNEGVGLPRIIDMGGMAPEAIISPAKLARLTMPTKLIWGENDPMAGPEIARRFADQLPDCELELWPGVGHAPWIDDPARAAASISEFLRR